MFGKILQIIKHRPFLILLIVITGYISVASIKLDSFLVGWDNYSSYLDLPINLYRTLFATWRDYRGLGVASDSEVTDIFRQIFSLCLSPIFRKTIIDQIYYIVSLNLGVFGMYALAQKIATKVITKNSSSDIAKDIFAFISAFFYLFNLNTLSVFYFPILPYISRFFGIPIVILIFLELLSKKSMSFKKILLIVVALLFVTTSYVTATVFITIMVVIGIITIVQKNFGKALIIVILMVLMNSFWLFPFANYTIQKAGIIRLARTFIDANETQFNQPKSTYSLVDQLILKPNFFATQYTSLDGTISNSFYSTSDDIAKSGLGYYIQFIFPALMIVGAIVIVFRAKKLLHLIWIPIVIVLFIFLSMKEYSLLGFVYAWINKYVPLFGVIFRFGDTKFHPFIAFAGSLSAGIALTAIYQLLTKFKPKYATTIIIIAVLTIITPIVITYKSFFQGDLIGFFMYNKIPSAYFKIAQTINTDKTDGRVIHLPFDQSMYWRSHNWGYLGSSFFNFMISKPYLDKTFEPGSMENAYVMKHIADILVEAKNLKGIYLENKALEIHNLLSRIGVSYIVVDETVSAQIPPRGVTFWGMYDYYTISNIVNVLEKANYISIIQSEEVKLADYANVYKQLLPIDQSNIVDLLQQKPNQIKLYKLATTSARVKTIAKVTNIDNTIANVIQTRNLNSQTNTIQKINQKNSTYFPFKDRKLPLQSDRQSMQLTIARTHSSSSANIITQATQYDDPKSYLVSVQARQDETNVYISLANRFLPTINKIEYLTPITTIKIPRSQLPKDEEATNINQYVSDWHTLPIENIGTIRLQIGETILPLPAKLQTTNVTIGEVVVHADIFDFKVLVPDQRLAINPNTFALTDNPNCLEDRRDDYTYSLSKSTQGAVVNAVNGSTCVRTDLMKQDEQIDYAYTELQFSTNIKSEDLDRIYANSAMHSSKPLLKEIITNLPKLSYLKVCVKESALDQCYNNHQIVSLHDKDTYIFPVHNIEGSFFNPVGLFTLINNGYQKQQLIIYGLIFSYYKPVIKQTVAIANIQTLSTHIELENGDINMTIPKALSRYSYYFNPDLDGYQISTAICDEEYAYRTYRQYGKGAISYFDNCPIILSQKIPYSSDNFVLWNVDYNLLSGRYPQFKISDSFNTIYDDIASLDQGYPQVTGFSKFSNPEMSYDTQSSVKAKLKSINTQNAYGYIYPMAGFANTKDKSYTLQQFGDNEGAMIVDKVDIIDLPTTWQDMQIVQGNPVTTYDIPQKIAFSQLLPSLWKMTINKKVEDTLYLIEFNTGYDSQWGMFDSLTSVIIGKPLDANHSRCNGYSNCYEVKANWKEPQKEFFLFYYPERLAIVGWVVTFSTAILGVILFSKRFKKQTH